ncbi:NADH dehydrogenase, partial [candidate division MSBL1 archaeon SCGC-AAA259A05]
IGAYAIGADEGFIFVRNEYPKAVERLELAVEQARNYGLLGDDIMNSGFSFDVDIHKGGGAFVCGEETALMSAIEGKMPNPRPRPPYPTESGLWGKPTVINNVKSWANIPVIIKRGGKYLFEMGTKRSGGTKVFSLVGDVRRRGLIEVKLGTYLEEIVIDIGNANKEEIKAVQTGGPSGGFIPAKHLGIPLDYETLTELGSIMGSGGLVVSDKNSCMVDMARYFLDFTLSESCGQCTPCREGLERMLEILDRITQGRSEEGDIRLLRELSEYVKDASLCALGGTAPNPVLSTLDNFEEEYREHVEEKRCRSGVCDLSGGEDE